MTLHDELAKEFDKVISRFKSDEIILTPFFNIGKNVPENLQQYKRFEKRKKRFFFTSYKFNYIFRLALMISRAVIHHIYWFGDYKKFFLKLPKVSKQLFLSHFTGVFNQLNESDRYFGEIVTRRKNLKEKNLILLINHTRKVPKRQNKSKFSSDSIYLILPKTTNTKTMWQIFVKQFQNFIYILHLSRKHGEIPRDERIFMYELAIQQLSQSALSQQILFSNLSYIITKVNTEQLHLTYEGHSYETYLARRIQSKFRNILVSIYQFAPIVPSQISFFKNIGRLPKSINIHVTGKSIVREIVRMTRILPNEMNIIGSSKNKEKIDVMKLKKHKIFTVIFAPEGLQDSFFEFMELADKCAQHLTNCRIVIRAHPDTLKNNSQMLNRILLKNTNLIFSNQTLENDLSESTVCVYRSSAVGIQGLQYGVIPIHFSKFKDGSIDPIRLEDLKHLRLNESESLIHAIETYVSMPDKNLLKLQCSFPKVFEKYFARLSMKQRFVEDKSLIKKTNILN